METQNRFAHETNEKSEEKNQTKMEWKAITLSANFGGGEWLLEITRRKLEERFRIKEK